MISITVLTTHLRYDVYSYLDGTMKVFENGIELNFHTLPPQIQSQIYDRLSSPSSQPVPDDDCEV